MDLIFLVALLLAAAGAVPYLVRRSREADAARSAVADRLGVSFAPRAAIRPRRLHGTIDGCRVDADTFVRTRCAGSPSTAS